MSSTQCSPFSGVDDQGTHAPRDELTDIADEPIDDARAQTKKEEKPIAFTQSLVRQLADRYERFFATALDNYGTTFKVEQHANENRGRLVVRTLGARNKW